MSVPNLAINVLEAMAEAFISVSGDTLSYVNARAQSLLTIDADEWQDCRLWDVLPSLAGGDFEDALKRAAATQLPCELDQYHAESGRWLAMRLIPQGATVSIFFEDISDQKRAQKAREQVHVSLQSKLRTRATELERLNEKLLHDSLHHALTGLPNRSYLLDTLRRALAANREGQAVLLLDFDGFKFINDSFGYGIGDELLVALAKRLVAEVRGGEFLAHIGGDEFVLLLDDMRSTSQLLAVVERLQASLSQAFEIRDYSLFISVSIGIVGNLLRYTEATDVLRDADIAMYQAKRSGKGQYTLFDKALRERILSRVTLESDLRFAAERGELLVHFQPIIDVASLETTGFESLVRWQHPTKGLIGPDHFIPIAEESGLITTIDMWVVQEACKQFKRWRDVINKPLKLNVNFSGRQFARSNLCSQLASILSDTGVGAEQLNIEITETVLMDNTVHTQQSLAGLRDLGVNLHIDDFGTGYSSLSYLQRFPAQCLKLDQSFIGRLGEPKGAELIQSLISMAHSLNMEVTTEGVETGQQLEVLRNLNCDFAQGFFLAKPMPAVEAFNFLKDQQFAGAYS